MSDPLAALLGLDGVEASIKHTIDTVALAAANGGDDVRAGAVTWFKKELIEGLSSYPEFAGKNLSAVADALSQRLVKRIAEIGPPSRGNSARTYSRHRKSDAFCWGLLWTGRFQCRS